jgi:hypothetical protein
LSELCVYVNIQYETRFDYIIRDFYIMTVCNNDY